MIRKFLTIPTTDAIVKAVIIGTIVTILTIVITDWIVCVVDPLTYFNGR